MHVKRVKKPHILQGGNAQGMRGLCFVIGGHILQTDTLCKTFRATFCTNLLRKGVDLRTVMSLMGPKDIESTMRYLRSLEGTELCAKINSAFS